MQLGEAEVTTKNIIYTVINIQLFMESFTVNIH